MQQTQKVLVAFPALGLFFQEEEVHVELVVGIIVEEEVGVLVGGGPVAAELVDNAVDALVGFTVFQVRQSLLQHCLQFA